MLGSQKSLCDQALAEGSGQAVMFKIFLAAGGCGAADGLGLVLSEAPKLVIRTRLA